MNKFDFVHSAIKGIPEPATFGRVKRCSGLLIEADYPSAAIGDFCRVYNGDKPETGVRAEVIGFNEQATLLMAFEALRGIQKGDRIAKLDRDASIRVGEALIGRVIDAFGDPLDDKGEIQSQVTMPIHKGVINPLNRSPIDQVMPTGIRAIDGFLTMGQGQRLGLFAGSGVGKSVLLSSICKQSDADINVIALIGERGREVEDFVNQTLGKEGLSRSIVIAATAQESPLARVQAVYSAIAMAESFAEQGKNVFFTMDSITRFATALRDIGLSAGEPPTVKGYTPSVFSTLPALIERCGNFRNKGSITALFTVLVESDDFNDPVVDCVRAVLDGHIVLTRELAEQGHYPAIDIAKSISRLFSQLQPTDVINSANENKKLFADFHMNKDVLELGLFSDGRSDLREKTISHYRKLQSFVTQKQDEKTDYANTLEQLLQLQGESA